MADDLSTEIRIGADATGVEAGVGRAKKSLASLGDTAQKIGKSGADGMQALGAGADQSSRKVESATKNMVGSLQRQIAAMEAGDKTSRKYQETLARMRGVDVNALKPYLDQLDSLQVKTSLAEKAQASFNSVMLKSAAALATAGAIANYIKVINDGVDALNDLKDATGASIENISALEDVGKRAGASFDVVSTSLVKFNNVLSDAKPGSAAEQAIKALGLSVEDLKRLDPAEALRQTSVALNKFADDGDKARLVQELFGKSVKEVAPFLKDLAESGALVATVTTEQAEQAEKFNKELAALSKNVQDASRSLVGPMVSAINEVIAKFREGREEGKGFLEIMSDRYWSNIRNFYGMGQPEKPRSTGGATGSWGDEPTEKPSVGPLPDLKKPKTAKVDLSDYDKLIQKLGVEIPKAAAEAEAAQNGYNKAQEEFLALAASPAWAKFTTAQRANVAALFEKKIAAEVAATAQKKLDKADLEAAQSHEKYLASLASGTEKIRADIQAQQDANARMGLSKQAIAALDAAKLEMLATDTELQAIKVLDRNLDQKTYDALKEQAGLYRDLAKAKQDGAAKEASIEYEKASADAAQKAQEDWRRAAESINNSLTDALLRGFESGKGFAKNFVDTMKNLFSTLVLRPVISAIVSPVAGALTGALGLAAPAAAAASGASALSGASGLLSGVGMLAGNFGAGITTGFGQLLSGNILGGLQLGGGLIGSGATAGGLGTIAGVLGPIALGIGALTAIIGKTKGETRTGGQFGVAFDGQVTNNRRGETYTYQGQQFDRDFSNGQRNALVNGQAYRLEGDPVAQEQAIRDAVAGTASGINAFFEALGSTARLSAFSAGLETSGKGRGGVFAGGTLSNGVQFGESGKGDNYAGTLYEAFSTNSPDFKTALENFTLDLKQSTIQALQSVTDIPEAIKKQIEGVDAESLTAEAADSLLTAINAQIVGVEQFKTALDGMGLTQFADMAFDTAAAIAEAAGGFDKLNSSLASYYQNYYSEAERAANTTRMVSEALAEVGLQMPKTRDEFRALVESQLALGDAGAEAVAVLLGMSDAFASITEGASSVQDAFRVTADGLQSILEEAVTNAGSAAEASRNASRAFEESIYSGLQDNLLGDLSGLLAGAINPMIDSLIGGAAASSAALAAGGATAASSMAAGGAIGASATAQGGAAAAGAMASGGSAAAGAMVSGGAAVGGVVSSVLDQARAYIDAYSQIINDPAIRDMIGQISGLVGNVAGETYTATSSWGGGGGGFVSQGSSMQGGAKDYQDALKSIGDTIEDEVKRLRGLMVEDSPFSKDVLLAQFATATAQARAGDKDALAKLPDLSKAIESASAVTAVSAVEMARTRGWLAGSLEETLKALGLTGAGGVTPVIAPTTPTTTPTTTPPKVITPVYNPAISGATMDPALLAAVKELNVTLKAIQSDGDADQVVNQNKLGAIHTTLRNIEELTALSLPTGVTA